MGSRVREGEQGYFQRVQSLSCTLLRKCFEREVNTVLCSMLCRSLEVVSTCECSAFGVAETGNNAIIEIEDRKSVRSPSRMMIVVTMTCTIMQVLNVAAVTLQEAFKRARKCASSSTRYCTSDV